MLSVLQLRRVLDGRPESRPLAVVGVRSGRFPADAEAWLKLRDRAFATLTPAVRPWTLADLRRELLDQSWWRPEHVWFAESGGTPIGMVTLAVREGRDVVRPAVHWLAVLPEWQRCGVAGLLLDTLHAAAWSLGHREVFAETHVGWAVAVRFYERNGYTSIGA